MTVSGDHDLIGARERVVPAVSEALARSYELGFLGSMPIEDQIDHGLGFVVVLEGLLGRPPHSVIDLGTGGGVPGLVLASCWPSSRVVLMDASQRRTAFLEEILQEWPGSNRAEVVRGRAEELGRVVGLRESFEIVTSRSFGMPGVTAECGSAFLSPDGAMVVAEPPEAQEEERWPIDGLEKVGLRSLGPSRVADRFGYHVLQKTVAIDDRFPRRIGIPAKRPLF